MAVSDSPELADVRAATQDTFRAAVRQAIAVRQARAAGVSWREIGELFGVSQQAAHNRWSGYCTNLNLTGVRLPKLRNAADRWLSESQVSTMLGIDLTTFRVMPTPPPFTIRQGATFYRESDVFVWVEGGLK